MRIFCLFLLILLPLLAGCAAPQGGGAGAQARYSPPGTPGGRLCTSQCATARTYCEDACHYRERICTYDVQAQAIRDYEAYVEERFKEKGQIELRPRDFEHMELCAPTTCLQACQSAYDSCFRKCGGVITFE